VPAAEVLSVAPAHVVARCWASDAILYVARILNIGRRNNKKIVRIHDAEWAGGAGMLLGWREGVDWAGNDSARTKKIRILFYFGKRIFLLKQIQEYLKIILKPRKYPRAFKILKENLEDKIGHDELK
jgi:hypothetical protein